VYLTARSANVDARLSGALMASAEAGQTG
jgi:hypothetical protein